MSKHDITHMPSHHPAVLRELSAEASDLQLRIADLITRFAGSMLFVYLHVVGFAIWMVVAERSPWPTLTLIVSLEAIFLSTFVMIGQNRQAAFQRSKADHDFVAQEQELHVNTDLTRTIDALVREIHGVVVPRVRVMRRLTVTATLVLMVLVTALVVVVLAAGHHQV